MSKQELSVQNSLPLDENLEKDIVLNILGQSPSANSQNRGKIKLGIAISAIVLAIIVSAVVLIVHFCKEKFGKILSSTL